MESTDLYLDSGYLNMGAVIDDPHFMRVVVSARGPGKTFGALSQAVIKGLTFLYLRRTKTQLDICSNPLYSPFKRINAFYGWDVQPKKGSGLAVFQDGDHVLGYAGALSTFRNVRGFDGSDIDLIIWDEFIPEEEERVIFNDFAAFLNVVETVARNREMEGRGPVKILLCANANKIYGYAVNGLRIENDLIEMRETGEEIREITPELLLVVPKAEKFTEEKRLTALYRLTAGSRFSEMAIDNRFRVRSRDKIGKRPLAEFVPLCGYKGEFVYRHKADRSYYICTTKRGSPPVFEDTPDGKKKFLTKFAYLEGAHTRGRVYFETLHDQASFFEMIH